MPTPPPLPWILEHEPFAVSEAREAGVPLARLRRSDLTALFRGVRSSTAPANHIDRCRAYAPLLRPGHVFCRHSAANLWGIWLPWRLQLDERVAVLAVRPSRAPRMSGVLGYRAESARLSLVAGLPVTSAADTWCDLGTVLELDELIAAGDSLVRRKSPRCTLRDLEEAASHNAGKRGMRAIWLALPQVRAGCDSARETDLRLLLVRAGLPEPEVNGLVSRPGTTRRFGDLVFRRWKVIAEYDGEHHRRDAKRYASDIQRLEELAREGWIVVRVLGAHFSDPAAIVARVSQALRDRGWRGN